MKYEKIVNTIPTRGIFANYLFMNEMVSCGDLPDIPKDYTLYKVNNDKDVESVLNMMRIRNCEIDMEYPEEVSGELVHIGKCDYEDECFFVMLWFSTVYDYWVGKTILKEIKINDELGFAFDCLGMQIWRWIRNEITTKKLKKECKKFDSLVKGGE